MSITSTRTNFAQTKREYTFSIGYVPFGQRTGVEIHSTACVKGKNLGDAVKNLCAVIGRDLSEFTIYAIA